MNLSITSIADGRCAQNQRRGLERLEQIGELDRQHRLGGRQRDEVDLRLEHDAERAFRSDHQLRQIERPVGADELVEVVAADTAQHFRKPAIDFTGVLLRETPDDPIALGFEPVAGAFRLELVRATAARKRVTEPSESTTSCSSTWSIVLPYSTERAPLELLAIMPPMVARLAVEMSGANRSPCVLSCAFSSSSTIPGSTRAQRSPTFSSSTRLRYFEVSTMTPGPMAWPA